jgi:ABC-type branched-subunit amino acid transport system ATPase component
MAEGHVIAEGPPSVIARNPEVIEAYLGKHRGEEPE